MDVVAAAGVGIAAAAMAAPGILYLAKSAHARELGGIQSTLTAILDRLAKLEQRLFGDEEE